MDESEKAIKMKEYMKEYMKDYRIKNKEYIKELNRKYYLKNRERLLKVNKDWKRKNKNRKKELDEQWKEENKEKYDEYQRKYQKRYRINNLKKIRARGIARRNIKISENQLCELCQLNKAQHKHHEDYSKPLEVICVCISCHNKIHRRKINVKYCRRKN